jgi:hypothetical protein
MSQIGGPSSDIRLRDPSSNIQVQTTTYSRGEEVVGPVVTSGSPRTSAAAVVVPAQHGELAIGPDGRIDYRRAPQRPDYLPANVQFKATVVKNRWNVELLQDK